MQARQVLANLWCGVMREVGFRVKMNTIEERDVDSMNNALKWLQENFTDDSIGTMKSIDKRWKELQMGGEVNIDWWMEDIDMVTKRIMM